jgi:aspartate aminotransferase
MQIEFEKRRNYFYDALVALKMFTGVKPQGAFYLFMDVTSFYGKNYNGTIIANSIDVAMFLLNEANVAAVPGSAFGAEGFMRFSYATSMENLQKAITKISAAIAKL